MSSLPAPVRLGIAVAGIFLSFSYSAVCQEDLYKTPYGEDGERFSYTFLALVVERGVNVICALIGVLAFGGSGVKIPYTDIFNSGVSTMLAMAASNEALRYVSYPTQVLGKSGKMVPVMAGGIVLGGKSYSVSEYVQVALVTIGVMVFNFGGKSKKGGSDSTYGMLLILVSLTLDAVTGGLQDKVKKRTKELNVDAKNAKPTMYESMLYTNLSGTIVALVFAVIAGQLGAGIAFCMKYPDVLYALVVYSLASSMGQNFIYYTITQFSPLLLTTVTTTRKIFSTLYSVFRDPSNSLSTMQWSGCGLVFVGLFIEVAAKYLSSSKPAAPAAAPAKKPTKAKKAD